MKLQDIDFRVWDNEAKEYNKDKEVLLSSDNKIYRIHTITGELQQLRDEFLEIEFWTGLIDSDGLKIYEGDIVKIENSVGVIEFSLGIGSYVRYCDKSISLGALHPYIEKIIGNIHENPELLESLEN